MVKTGRKTDGNYQNRTNRNYRRKYSKAYTKNTFSKSYLFDPKPPKIERKNVDTFGPYNCPPSATFGNAQFLTTLAQGVGATERLGRSVRLKSVQIRLTPREQSGSTNNWSQHRYLVIYDRQSNGSVPVSTDVISGGQYNGPMSLANSERFVVVLDRMTDSIQSSTMPISDKAYQKINLDQIWTGSTGGSTSCITGGLWLLIANNSDEVIGKSSVVDFYARVRYTDC